ncbi:TlpA family protein disulfide reductase [Tessaracoccus sp. MC1865]|uniref:TlpA family protein disulfide reductase n=1 Tax=Tessaracoccus sp. MC1865 TaxID=2760310 RepID=UPI001602B975|nr:TlpA disulfide reductase family protein [Tessaracoccus sp. MC1865]MBB1483990.1 TlpA family protein disulfide reductase [Tessaracoccus sp. MC1865]QTO37034.1 TlpA family protein disulfide reductase [Tessaracoccus sp. MC1865]
MTRLVAGLAAAALLLTACSTAEDEGAGGTAGFVGGDGSVTIIAPEERSAAPVLEGETLDGETLSTADLAGQPLIINVWGSWCAPCRAEAPELVKSAAELEGSANFLGINTRDTLAAAQAFERSFGIEYPSLHDPDGVLLLEFAQLPPKAIPSTVVIDAEGRVAARVLGEVSASTLKGIVEDVNAS